MGLTLCRNKGRDKTGAMMRSGDRLFTKAKRSNRDVLDQNELQTYAPGKRCCIRRFMLSGNSKNSQHTTFVLGWLALDRGYIKSHSASLDDPFNPSQF
ncbi:hypothetical protein F2Q69_00008896 [Brassica cretica]|uniref:Uncharacterized protein n=1 Tax=Brassica cretica TaxID=69181 RepID=A0A8S9PKD3_BRACR|nr:hypothetical protein F2Q69_00008896 [Brassica cretica]